MKTRAMVYEVMEIYLDRILQGQDEIPQDGGKEARRLHQLMLEIGQHLVKAKIHIGSYPADKQCAEHPGDAGHGQLRSRYEELKVKYNDALQRMQSTGHRIDTLTLDAIKLPASSPS